MLVLSASSGMLPADPRISEIRLSGQEPTVLATKFQPNHRGVITQNERTRR